MKRIFAMLLCLCMVLALAACGGNGEGAQSGGEVKTEAAKTEASSDAASSDSGSGEGSAQSKEQVPNKVMAIDQHNQKIIVYDLDKISAGDSLDLAEEWSVDAQGAGLKYREDTVFGDVILLAGTPARMYSYPEGEILWSTNAPGTNPHSIEILPSGNIVIANSTGGTVRFFNTSALLDGDTAGAGKWHEYTLPGAHGVLWDPEYDVLWALGDDDLVAYTVSGTGTSQKLIKVNGMGAKLPEKKNGGHDLAADLTDTRYLYLSTNAAVFRFDKEENELIERFDQYGKLSTTSVKGFGNNQNGNFFYCFPNHGPGTAWENEERADWCTDTIYFCYWKTENFMYKQAYVSDTAAFYKCRVFYGQYQ